MNPYIEEQKISKSYTLWDVSNTAKYQTDIINDIKRKFQEITNLMSWYEMDSASDNESKYPSVSGVHAINQQLWENNKELKNLLEIMDWFIEMYIK